ncbi:MAG: hypothetical protein U9O64_03920 [Campylobacterota bacterium]|nr:hypothetical protein [Campylobacterota bacterium]
MKIILTSYKNSAIIRIMKTNSFYILSLLLIIFTVMSFDNTSPKLMDSNSKTQVETLFEDKTSEQVLDEKLIGNVSDLFMKNKKLFTGFESLIPSVNQLYLNNIFKPPKFS